MRSNVNIWWLLTAFFALVGVTYVVWNIVAHNDRVWYEAIEWVGTVTLFFGAFMSVMVAFYLHLVQRSQRGALLPEDRLDADIDDGEAEMGEFSPWSWWPIVLAGSAAIGAIGLAVGSWLMPVSLAVFAIAIVGWVYEYYRGHFAR